LFEAKHHSAQDQNDPCALEAGIMELLEEQGFNLWPDGSRNMRDCQWPFNARADSWYTEHLFFIVHRKW
jgi:hypothetical protein